MRECAGTLWHTEFLIIFTRRLLTIIYNMQCTPTPPPIDSWWPVYTHFTTLGSILYLSLLFCHFISYAVNVGTRMVFFFVFECYYFLSPPPPHPPYTHTEGRAPHHLLHCRPVFLSTEYCYKQNAFLAFLYILRKLHLILYLQHRKRTKNKTEYLSIFVVPVQLTYLHRSEYVD
jgi:hypothetical protein